MSDEKKPSNVINIKKLDPALFEKEQMPYTLICNEVINKCTNYTACCIWIYLQSKPPTWLPCKWEIMKRFNISEPTYKRHMRYLSATGLVEHHQDRNNDGTVGVSRIVVLNGSGFNPDGIDVKGTVFDTVRDEKSYDPDFQRTIRSIKNDPAADHAPDKGSNRGIKNDPTVIHRGIKKPHTGEMTPHINTRLTSTKEISHTKGDEFFLETTLFTDSEQQRKAIVMRKLCLTNEKAKLQHEALKSDKTFLEVLDECVSHYATQQKPQLVSPQRLQSWIARESRFQKTQIMSKPAQQYPSQKERERVNQEISAREKDSQKRKADEVKASKGFKDIVREAKERMGFAEAQKKADEEMKRLGMNPKEYCQHVLKTTTEKC